MVDAIDLRLAEDLAHLVIEEARRLEVSPEGLLDDEAPPAPTAHLVIQPDATHLAHDFGDLRRLSGQIEEPVAGGPALRVELIELRAELVEGVVVREVELLVDDSLGQLGPGRFVDGLDARVLLD